MFNEAEAMSAIHQRNAIRAEAKLPLLSVPDELAKMKATYEQAAFDEFVDVNQLLYDRIWTRKVARERVAPRGHVV